MKVLIACEESQTVCKAFRERGHEAYSCDIQPPSGGHPEWHVQGDALKMLRGGEFETTDGQKHFVDKWDLLIAHPPCTYLTVSGNRWFNVDKYGDKARKRIVEREDAAAFFMAFINAPVEKIAVENPVGYMSSHFRKPDCIIQPFQFGEHARKGTCLWLKNLQPLTPTKIVDPGEILPGGYSVGASANFATDANGKILRWNDPRTQKSRSKTFPGIAKAMAEQWGSLDKEAHNGSIH
jgi:hypothetical protein